MSMKSFLKGVGSVLNIFGSGGQAGATHRTKVMDYEEARKADAEALKGDWDRVGNDMRTAMNKDKRK